MMKAEDTVMSQTEATRYIDRWLNGEIEARHVTALIAEAQAEISFKAGYEERDKWLSPNEAKRLEEALLAGRREVVEWIRKQPQAREGLNIYLIPEYELAEWGIEKK